jgi:AcrR family transcriptional regulator
MRKYELKERATKLAATRRRIVAATVGLHEEVGPSRTTISAIAERAGVSRPTVYSQLPDESALFAACAEQFAEHHPAPDLDALDLAETLRALYAYYRSNARMLANTYRDAQLLPALDLVLGEWRGYLNATRDRLSDALGPSSRAPIGHALAFSTWHSLAREQGIDDDRAVALMLSFVEAA